MAREPGPSGALDLDLLASQSLGDRALEADLLALFEQQAARLWPIIAGPGEREDRAHAAHTLKGGAAAIGARKVMRLAGELEDGSSGASSHAAELLAALDGALQETYDAISTWRRAG